MTIAQNFASKASIAFVAAAMIFSLIAPAAQAQSSEDMQKMINDLMAQIAALQGQVGGSSSAAATGYTWTRDLKTGSTGADVKALQVFLNSDADTRVAATGAGSAGMETETFGPATAAAVSKFQVKYRADILAPANLVNPTGTFGPATRAKANALNMVSTPVDNGGDEDEDTTDEEDEDTNDGELSGEASLDTFELEDGESTIEEGETDVTIGEITVEFADGDASISRMDVMLTGSNQPWDAFETISLWVDGEMVAEVDAADEDDYLDEDTGELRFSGLDIVAMEDESLDIAIGASIQNNLDNTELVDWTAKVTSVRYFDADGVATTDDATDGIDTDTSSFEIQTAGTDEEIDLSLATSNPDATDIVVDTDTDTNDVTVLVADIEATDSDIELNQVVVKVDVANGYSTTTVATVVDEVRVVIDGQSFKAESVATSPETDYAIGNGSNNGITEGYSENANSGMTSVWYLFDIDGDVVVDEDGEVSMEVVVDLNDTDDATRYPNGTTITASVTSVERGVWEAEGAEDLGSSQFSGTAVGDTHTLVAEGIVIPVDSVEVSAATTGDNDQTGEFTIEFEVTAIEGDFYITDNVFASTTATNGIAYMVEVGSGTTTDSGVLSSTADEETDGVFTVREGETETFTLTVTVDTSASTQARVTLSEVNYSTNEDGTSATMAVYTPTPASDYRTAYKNINAN